ncbi:unnamed protein product [Chondrus crispus]|uniref:Probable ATP-dependent transporter ycf16 n=1 Tax=Chondrus crispus TaxID=2769 RepID=R7QUB8_CHOCR|nr:unnamed protein product [Chondrus crispus]CDF41066.1 unnamed protein product [Chondrus crispus]|eukprot:XP_005711360.1 unnamed protein product [Chondrus crispus]
MTSTLPLWSYFVVDILPCECPLLRGRPFSSTSGFLGNGLTHTVPLVLHFRLSTKPVPLSAAITTCRHGRMSLCCRCWHAWVIPGIAPPLRRWPLSLPATSPRRRRRVTAVAEQTRPRIDGKTIKDPGHDPPPFEVELKDVWVALGGKNVLKGLNLNIRKGEATAIIGTSGTGKSTALRVITGLIMPDAGEHAALFDSITVGENVAFGMMRERGARRLPDERIYELVKLYLKRVDMEEAIDKFPEELSGGMKKRASVARAVIHDPEKPETAPDILVYDEPTAGLDPTASTRIENMIRDLQDVCKTCVVVTHQFSTIRRTADRVVLMHEGTVVWDGSVNDLDTTENPYVRQFMSASLHGPLNSADNIL